MVDNSTTIVYTVMGYMDVKQGDSFTNDEIARAVSIVRETSAVSLTQ